MTGTSMINDKFPITLETLAEMEQIAVRLGDDETAKLTWTQVQQVLTLRSFETLLKIYGLEAQFDLQLKSGESNGENN